MTESHSAHSPRFSHLLPLALGALLMSLLIGAPAMAQGDVLVAEAAVAVGTTVPQRRRHRHHDIVVLASQDAGNPTHGAQSPVSSPPLQVTLSLVPLRGAA